MYTAQTSFQRLMSRESQGRHGWTRHLRWTSYTATPTSTRCLFSETICYDAGCCRCRLRDADTISAFLDEMKQLEQQPAPTASKKKLTSTERRKRDRVLLLDSVAQLRLQLDGIKAGHQLTQQQHWNQHSKLLCDMEPCLLDKFRIRHALACEDDRAGQAAMLLQQMSNPMKVIAFHCVQGANRVSL